MYYYIIIFSVFMFGINFALQNVYRKERGDNLKVSLEAVIIGSLCALVVLLIINLFKFEFTFFTLFIASILSIINLLFTFFSFKALARTNLSVYSLFSMLGGMALPFLQGIIFYDEKITIAKVLCVVFIVFSLLLTIKKGSKNNNVIFYIGVFILNGLSGVISKIFTESTYEKTSAIGLNILVAICSIVFSLIFLILFFRKTKDDKLITIKNSLVIGMSGTINSIANFLLVIALVHVESSVQYPMVTGGVMIVSTLLCFFNKTRPSNKEILAVLLAFIGMLILFIVPL